ncbi:RmlC-like cupin domain-containing protein [Microdochium trichocladiopsis]|uniref:Mannose-6-phosphate isomerase n=1 Tax=Microdochium trichocladiopsis TaxID=1682393 RepID=A0A9P9BJJ7_9PEZI|nr:RmlC-like cupin domain-containing protein [Microdochium trichocladiopsis]KAH7018165.1 RmlC-like cupin domain-containing protein [Microdochium trichocladiopsis]
MTPCPHHGSFHPTAEPSGQAQPRPITQSRLSRAGELGAMIKTANGRHLDVAAAVLWPALDELEDNRQLTDSPSSTAARTNKTAPGEITTITTATMSERVFQLAGTCNNYPWGKKGRQSLAAQLCAKTPGTDFSIKDDEYYSEMWFGDYPDFPARKLSTGELLKDVLQANKEKLLGSKVNKHMGGQLPFLPKILSIAKALPLQIHPNRDLASKLHEKDPEKFTDDNHKPEIAVALSKFELFAGWKPLGEIAPVFAAVPELHQFLPSGTSPDSKWTDKTLREVTRNLLKASPETTKSVQSVLSTSSTAKNIPDYMPSLLQRLQSQYGPDDAGSLVALLCMNFFTFAAGDAVYIPADGIHAYLAGDIVECMARSNNVLNSGFCPRADRDNVDLFTDTLTFSQAHSRDDMYLPSKPLGKGSHQSRNGRTVVYAPPMSEFDMFKTDLQGPGDEDVLGAHEGPAVAIVTKGGGLLEADGQQFDVKEGYIFFVAPGVEVTWKAGDGKDGLQVHTAAV